MKKSLTILIFLFSIVSCNKDLENNNFSQLDWTIGENQNSAIKNILVDSDKPVFIELNSNSFCQNSGIKLIIKNNSEFLFNETINRFPFIKEFELHENSTITINTSVTLLNTDEFCKRLGNVECLFMY